MGAWIAFGALGTGTLAAAFMVVRSGDLVRAVLWLAATLAGTAALYATLNAGFLAAIQILLYAGGVITLMLFAVLLARRTPGELPSGGDGAPAVGAIAALAVLAVVARVVWTAEVALPADPMPPDTKALGVVILQDLVLPFEALSVLLLAAMVGAIALARKKDP